MDEIKKELVDIHTSDEEIYQSIRGYIVEAQNQAYQAVNTVMITAYHQVGEKIYIACGNNSRAEYGKNLLQYISENLTKEFGKGFTVRNLRNMRQFYLAFPIRHSLRAELSWTHYRTLIKIKDEENRNWYAEECIKSNWNVRQLERQINTMFKERLLASREKDAVAAEVFGNEKQPEYHKIVRDPYMLEFIDFGDKAKYYEKDLETALINHLQKFLLELGRGFCFEARQKHFRVDDEHFYIDLVFYNYILKCHVLIDLKIDKLTHQDLGQMQMYVNYYTRELMNEGDNPPIGIVLCADKSDAVVKYTLPEGNTQIFASKYMTCLPTEEELKRELNLEDFEKLD